MAYHTVVKERSPMNGEDYRAENFSLSACCCILLQPHLAFVFWCKTLVMKVVITTNIPVSRMARRLEGGIISEVRCGRCSFTGLLCMAPV
jgi:hypothetical protein